MFEISFDFILRKKLFLQFKLFLLKEKEKKDWNKNKIEILYSIFRKIIIKQSKQLLLQKENVPNQTF